MGERADGERFAGEGIRPDQTGDDGRGAAAQPAGRRHRQPHSGLKAHRFEFRLPPHPLGGSIHEVVGAAAQVTTFATFNNQIEAFAAAFKAAQFEAIIEVDGRSEAIKTRAQVSRGGGNIHHHPLADLGARHLQPSTGPTLPPGLPGPLVWS